MKQKSLHRFLFTVFFIIPLLPAAAQAGSFNSLYSQISTTNMEIQPYKPFYFIETYDRFVPRQGPGLESSEVKFQYSFKFPLHVDRLHEFSFGYTQLSFWQLSNARNSSPFRESNYQPEFFYILRHETNALSLTAIESTLGAIHESNGQGGTASRSWNRVYEQVRLYWEHVKVDVRPWYRIPEQHKTSSGDTRGDDNPDILRYMGNGELSVEYQNGRSDFILTGRNNLRSSPNYGAIQLDYIYLLHKQFNLYVQYFSGYGESLIDYNRYNERIGAGVMFVTWR